MLPIIDEPPKSFNPLDQCTQTLPSYGYGNCKFKMAMNNDLFWLFSTVVPTVRTCAKYDTPCVQETFSKNRKTYLKIF